MWRAILAVALGVALTGPVVAHTAFAQHHPAAGSGSAQGDGSMPSDGCPMHAQHMQARRGMAGVPTMPGQDAFGAIAEIVRILEADPAIDWSKVDLERLRQHLIDMNEVMLRSVVRQTRVSGGLAIEVTGTGRAEQAIHAMVVPHAAELDRMPEWSARTEIIPGGVRLMVTARGPDDAALIARIRGLGFAGLMTQGAHHQPHHLAMAKGDPIAGHTH
jgi:hypothetical protein